MTVVLAGLEEQAARYRHTARDLHVDHPVMGGPGRAVEVTGAIE